MIDATHMVAPDLLGNISWIVFGRLRPMHTNIVIFGFVGSALLGTAHYLIPTLLRAPLFSERIGKVSVWIWNLAVVTGTVTLSLGYHPEPGICRMDLAGRCSGPPRHGPDLLQPLPDGRPAHGKTSLCLQSGISSRPWSSPSSFISSAMPSGTRAPGPLPGCRMRSWPGFTGTGWSGLFLTPLAVAAAYYIIPIVSRSPLYSHTLSLVGFWTILMIYTHIGTHHLLQTPVPTWLKVLAITGSIGMLAPVMTVLVNLWLTARGRLGYIHVGHRGEVRLRRPWSGIS